MTEATMTDLALMVVEYSKDGRTESEIQSKLIREKVDADVAKNFTGWMVGRGYLKVSPGDSKTKAYIPGDSVYKLEEGDE